MSEQEKRGCKRGTRRIRSTRSNWILRRVTLHPVHPPTNKQANKQTSKQRDGGRRGGGENKKTRPTFN
ncbi:hypothetical protein BC939DRAFT_135557 [Gamsiella multidivaricata]|uniref:uncharacterized protein n=1 Tax=Gamsiella multidivaricata TaxID=101098 RepID=UPI002220724A|nr:uncharacterized protein BC939DRAFT_135557 [Gamsiella multidivaricata]KAI7824818.1 hypothetical protein BC939DRAFT_135557 [Gamsiella multidivaricata]